MIAGVRGTLEATLSDSAIVEVGGLSLRVFVPASSLARLPAIGQPVRLLTYLYLREDLIALYGFLTADDLALFEQLIGVTGVGPKLALGMLGSATSEALRTAIASENLDNLTRVPGIGKKLAGRLILELRGKLTPPEGGIAALAGSPEADVLEALVGLGYNPADAQAAVKSLPTDRELDLEDRLRLALRFFAKH